MSQYRTIFSSKNYDEILNYLETLKLTEVKDSDVITFETNYKEGNLQVSIKKRIEGGDSFSMMILGAWNFLRNIETKYDKQKKELIHRVSECETAIGIVTNSNFTETDERATFIYKLMEMFDGIMFDGQGMTDKNGKLILDYDGSSEVTN
jgi:hypothetical protein